MGKNGFGKAADGVRLYAEGELSESVESEEDVID
jgi:hypothetical protein